MNPNKEMKNYNSKKEDLEEEDQRQDERSTGGLWTIVSGRLYLMLPETMSH